MLMILDQLYLPFSLTQDDAERAVVQMEDCIEDIRRWMNANIKA